MLLTRAEYRPEMPFHRASSETGTRGTVAALDQVSSYKPPLCCVATGVRELCGNQLSPVPVECCWIAVCIVTPGSDEGPLSYTLIIISSVADKLGANLRAAVQLLHTLYEEAVYHKIEHAGKVFAQTQFTKRSSLTCQTSIRVKKRQALLRMYFAMGEQAKVARAPPQAHFLKLIKAQIKVQVTGLRRRLQSFWRMKIQARRAKPLRAALYRRKKAAAGHNGFADRKENQVFSCLLYDVRHSINKRQSGCSPYMLYLPSVQVASG